MYKLGLPKLRVMIPISFRLRELGETCPDMLVLGYERKSFLFLSCAILVLFNIMSPCTTVAQQKWINFLMPSISAKQTSDGPQITYSFTMISPL